MLDLGRGQGTYPYFPHEARIRNLTYDINTRVDIQVVKKKRAENRPGEVLQRFEKRQIDLGRIPVMIRSS